MSETRAGHYGHNLAVWIEYTIATMPQGRQRQYRQRFLRELRTYSFEPRQNGNPPNKGCVRELDGIDEVDITLPEELARLVKEGFHLEYQKQTSANGMQAVLRRLAPHN